MIRRKVFAYVSSAPSSLTGGASGRAPGRLLLLAHPDQPEAGLQVPAGTMEPGETPEDAVLREAREETGLDDLLLVSILGRQMFDARPFGRDEMHERWFVHLQCRRTTPDRWRTFEQDPADGGPPIAFELFWVPLDETFPALIADHDRFVPELIAALGTVTRGDHGHRPYEWRRSPSAQRHGAITGIARTNSVDRPQSRDGGGYALPWPERSSPIR